MTAVSCGRYADISCKELRIILHIVKAAFTCDNAYRLIRIEQLKAAFFHTETVDISGQPKAGLFLEQPHEMALAVGYQRENGIKGYLLGVVDTYVGYDRSDSGVGGYFLRDERGMPCVLS